MTGMVNDDLNVISNLDQNVVAGSDVIPVKINKDGSLSSSSKVLSSNAFSRISYYVDQTIKGIGIDILSGTITLNPFENKTATACDYCEFRKVCGYDGKISGYEKHKLEELSQEEAYEKIVGLKGESDSGNDIYRGPAESN
jgi:ATP-dependent helicase/nuclease subunit B